MSPDFKLRVTLEANVSASEDPEKVVTAMKNISGPSSYAIEEKRSTVRFRSEDPKFLDRLHDQLRDRHVRGAARRLLLRAKEGDSTSVMLNRQAAAAGVIVLCSTERESPLGPLFLNIVSKQLDDIIEWLASYGAE